MNTRTVASVANLPSEEISEEISLRTLEKKIPLKTLTAFVELKFDENIEPELLERLKLHQELVKLYLARKFKNDKDLLEKYADGKASSTASKYFTVSKYVHCSEDMLERMDLLFSIIGKHFLSKYFGFAGLLNGLDFIVGSAHSIKGIHKNYKDSKSQIHHGRQHTTLESLKKAIQKEFFEGARISRLFSAGFWFALNTATVGSYFVSPLLGFRVTMGGFLVETAHVSIVNIAGYVGSKKSVKLIVDKKQLINDCKIQHLRVGHHDEDTSTKLADTIAIAAAFEKELNNSKKHGIYNIFSTIIILFGISLLLLNSKKPEVLIAGGILCGFGLGISLASQSKEFGKCYNRVKQLIANHHTDANLVPSQTDEALSSIRQDTKFITIMLTDKQIRKLIADKSLHLGNISKFKPLLSDKNYFEKMEQANLEIVDALYDADYSYPIDIQESSTSDDSSTQDSIFPTNRIDSKMEEELPHQVIEKIPNQNTAPLISSSPLQELSLFSSCDDEEHAVDQKEALTPPTPAI